MKKLLLIGSSLMLLGGFAMAANGDGTKSVPTGGRGYGFIDANNDGINDNFVDLNGDGIDDNWVDENKDGINDLRGTKAGTGIGRRNQDNTTKTANNGNGNQNRKGSRGRK